MIIDSISQVYRSRIALTTDRFINKIDCKATLELTASNLQDKVSWSEQYLQKEIQIQTLMTLKDLFCGTNIGKTEYGYA
jgi:hypothetical protein